MAGALRKTMEYLGLAETDERYDDYDYDEPERAPERDLRAAPEPERAHSADVTPLPRRAGAPEQSQRTPVARVVREAEVEPMNRITTIHPRTYNEAKNIGEAFRGGIPVIMNLSDMDDSDAKRLVDFAAGLAFGLHGSIERVTSKVFLLSPSHVEVDGSEPAAPKQALFNQS
ncbi:cell division protein SepF [Ornithinimicrobium cryptoxanthini]|uniref:Cell division protein SepF n=1 Tax=Ornithinimicrobium cryptoxanthini TaxID=2934161 RepID=A0ABY4YL17_9MICO|nr:cell division protein SepF [Ornithinimicrobium cryptoxanthini]USQ77482.1 cell division protein SepF [Ornithinimicrobium cryptoxanthini]